MKFTSYLRSLFASPKVNRLRRTTPSLPCEVLERRTLLTGNVDVRMVGREVFLYGDNGDNSVEVVAEGGSVVVRGLSSTTINGSASAFTLINGSVVVPRSLTAFLRGGNNDLQIGAGVTIGRDAVIYSGEGNDRIGIVSTSVNRNLVINSAGGNDQLSVQNSSVGRNATLIAVGSSVVVNVSSTTTGGDLRIHTGSGNDDVVLTNSTVNDDTTILTHGGDDDVVIRNSTLHDDLLISTGTGSDIVMIDTSTVRDRTTLDQSSGSDNFVVQGQSVFQDKVRVFGGPGNDLAEIGSQVAMSGLKLFSASRGDVSDTLVADRITAPVSGAIARATAISTFFVPVLTAQLSVATVAESAGADASILTVTRSGPTTSPLVVNLTSSNTLKATVPATVTILAGQTSATVSVAAVNNTLFEPSASVTLTAQAADFSSGTTVLTVTSEDAAALALTSNIATVPENGGANAVTFTVSRNSADNSQPLTVNLSSGTPGRLTTATTVTIPANASSVTFAGAAVDNNVADGDATVIVSATATGFAAAQASVVVDDNEQPELSATLNVATVSESAAAGTAKLTVSRNTANTTAPLDVTIQSSATGRLTAPTTVTIPAGVSSATVNLTTVNNNFDDGDVSVTINVTATGLAADSVSITVTDDDVPAFTVAPATSTVSEAVGAAGLSITVSRNTVQTTDQTVSLNYSTNTKLSGPATVVIPANQTSVTFTATITDDLLSNANVPVTITASATGVTSGSSVVTVTDNDQIALTTNISQNTTAQSNGTVITRNAQFNIRGTTEPGATVSVDSDADGQFDDASVTAAQDGTYSLNVGLLNNTVNRGANVLAMRASLGQEVSNPQTMNVHLAVGTVMRFETNVGAWDAELLDADAPQTVQNFLSYASSPRWDNLIVQRSDDGFVVQAGGFTASGSQLNPVTTNAAIPNEFNAANSNVTGTLSMALLSNQPNSGTSQWFINTGNNSALNAARHTVFGRVIGTGMTVVNQINNLTVHDFVDLYDNGSLAEVPLLEFNPGNVQLTGTVALTSGSAQVQGTGTQFTTQLQPGDSFQAANFLMFVQSIQSNTALTLTFNAPLTIAGVAARTDVAPEPDDFVIFNNIGEILDVL